LNAITALGGVFALLLIAGGALGMLDRTGFSPRWLLVATLVVVVNDIMLTRLYGAAPDLLQGDWNWQGKLLALAATLAIAALPMFGWRIVGLKLAQAPGSLRAALPVVALYCAFFVALALVFPNGEAGAEDLAFQLTLPGLEEEPFYRGLLLYALYRAVAGRVVSSELSGAGAQCCHACCLAWPTPSAFRTEPSRSTCSPWCLPPFPPSLPYG
jgi:uncharacterized protein